MMERPAAGDPGCEGYCDTRLPSSPICPSCRCVARDCGCGDSQVEGGGASQKRESLPWAQPITRYVLVMTTRRSEAQVTRRHFTSAHSVPFVNTSYNLNFQFIFSHNSVGFSYVPTIRRWLWRWHRRYRFGEQREDEVFNVNSGKTMSNLKLPFASLLR